MQEAKPTRQPQDIPEFYVGQRVEGIITLMKPSEYTDKKGTREQIQFDVKLVPNGYEARAWISYYKVPNPKQHIGKLYISIQRATGKIYENVDIAMDALREYGRIFLEVTGFNPSRSGDIMYPKFGVIPTILPGEDTQQQESPQQQTQQKPKLSIFPVGPLPTEMKGTPEQRMIAFLKANRQYIGEDLNDVTWNPMYENYLADDGPVVILLRDQGIIYENPITGLYHIDEKARELLK